MKFIISNRLQDARAAAAKHLGMLENQSEDDFEPDEIGLTDHQNAAVVGLGNSYVGTGNSADTTPALSAKTQLPGASGQPNDSTYTTPSVDDDLDEPFTLQEFAIW